MSTLTESDHTRSERIRRFVLVLGIALLAGSLGACSFLGLGGSTLSQEDIRATAEVVASTRVAQTAVVSDSGDGPGAIEPTPTVNLEGCFQEDLIAWRDMAQQEFDALQVQIETLYYANPTAAELQSYYDSAVAKADELAEMDYSFCEAILIYHIQLIDLFTSFSRLIQASIDGDTATYQLEERGFTKDLNKFQNLLLNLADEDPAP